MSTGEIILILFVYLLFFGAKGLPSIAQTLGKAVYQFRNAASDVQREIMQGANEIKKDAQALRLDQMDIADTPTPPTNAAPKQPQAPMPKAEPTVEDDAAPSKTLPATTTAAAASTAPTTPPTSEA